MRPLFSLVLALCLVAPSLTLFEDQAFKFDWRHQYLGVAQGVDFWETTVGSRVLIRTGSNTLASVDADSGDIKWRHILSDASLLEAALDAPDGKYLASISRTHEGEGDFSLSLWNIELGALAFESRVASPPGNIRIAFAHRSKQANLVSISPDGAIKIYSYDFRKGHLLDTYSYSTGAGDVSCSNLDTVFVCLSPELRMAYYTGLPLAKGASFNAIPLSSLLETGDQPISLERVSKNKAVVRLTSAGGKKNSLVLAFDNAGKLVNSNVLRGSVQNSNYIVGGCRNSDDLFLIEQECKDKSDTGCQAFSRQVKISALSFPHETIFKSKVQRGQLVRAWASCDPASGGEPNYQLILQFEDGSLSSVTPLGNLMWSREDSLASIAAVQLISMGLHVTHDTEDGEEMSSLDLAGSIYDGAHERDIFEQFGRRLKLHAAHLHATFSYFFAVKDLSLLFQMKDTSVDDFGIRKVIVAATQTGKIYGIDSITGKILWQIYHGGNTFQNLPEQLFLFVQRSSLHYGFEARCTLICRDRSDGLPKLIHFNPLNGKLVSSKKLQGSLMQAILLHHTSEDHIRPIMLVTEGYKVELEPQTALKHLKTLSGKMYLAVTDSNGEKIQGNRLVISKEGEIQLAPVWTFTSPGTKILRLVSKPTDEVVHSQGRVMADRSVLFKYINPNLGFIMTEGKEKDSKSFINVYLIDLVTGRILFSASHKRVMGPYHIVHSENWAVYTYYNEKARRAELVSLELFEGATQSNGSVFSSLSNTVTPLVERQAFILGPTYVTAMKDTVTDKGITTKHILMATTAGAIYDVSRHFLDPRRPNMNTPMEMREPGLPAYIPELQFPPEVILNYNQSVAGPRGIVTSPTDLESTSVVFAYGQDLYCTRVTPSKGFDLLKDDFDYSIITLVLVALVAASVATRKFSQLKNLRHAWR